MITALIMFALASPPARADWVIPKPTRAVSCAVDMMRQPCWHCRESGSRILHREAACNPRMIIYVAAYSYDLDPEVRWRCAKILRRLAPCQGCHGLGYWGDRSAPYACGTCGGRRVIIGIESTTDGR